MARAEARQAALQLIYAEMLGGEGGQQALEALVGMNPTADDALYIEKTRQGVLEKQRELDGAIERFLNNWSLDRLSKVDLAILRLAAFEMLYCEDIPGPVAVSEAVELSHTFSTDESGPFINGVLGSLLRQGAAPR